MIMINNFLIPEYYYFFTVFFISAFFTLFFIKIFPLIKFFVKNSYGPQRIHKEDVSRLGGLPIFLTFFITLLYKGSFQITITDYLLFILPVFLIGLIEDIRQVIKPNIRLMSAFVSAIIFVYITSIIINRLGFYISDLLLNYKFISIVFTVLCVVYLIQAFNIIDGLNGLSLCTGIICLLSIAVIAKSNLNDLIFLKSLTLVFILLGVLLFNFFGKIFIGDSGAYFIGLIIATITINLSLSNENLSPLVIALILIYPSWELLRTIFRRFLNKKNIFQPDAKHLHSLLYIINLQTFNLDNLKTNIFTSLQIIFLQFTIFLYIINFYNHEGLVILGIATFIFIYEFIYLIANKKTRRMELK